MLPAGTNLAENNLAEPHHNISSQRGPPINARSKEPDAEGGCHVIQPLSAYGHVTVVTVIVDLERSDGYVLTGNDVHAATKLSGPAIGASKTRQMTTTYQGMNKRLRRAVGKAFGEPRSRNVCVQASAGSI